MLDTPSKVLRFDKFTLDLARSILLKGEEELALRRQSFDVLRHLAERRGEVVSRDELIGAVWVVPPARPEDSVAQCIKEIRRALGGDARRIVKTVPGRGYAFMAGVTVVEVAPAAASQSGSATEVGRHRRPGDAAPAREWRSVLNLAPLHRLRGLIVGGIILLAAGGWLVWQQAGPKPKLDHAAHTARPDDRYDRSRRVTLGGQVTCGFRGCQTVPEGCIAVRYMGGNGLGGRIFCGEELAAFKATEGASKPPAVLTMMAVPTLAVLPFTTPDGEPAVAGEARAFTGEVATEIARCNIASMLSLKPAAGRRGEAADPKAAGPRLDVRYLLVGRLGREGREHAGNVRLIEAETGRDLWVRPFRYGPGERTAPAVDIALAAAWNVLLSETQRPLPAVPEAGHYAILAFANMKNLHRSAALAEKALELDRNWVPALLGYAWAQVMLSLEEPREARPARLVKAHEAVERAIELAPHDAFAYHRRGQVLRERGDPFGAIAANQQALKLSPNLSIAHADIGMNKIAVGLAHETMPHIVEATRLSTNHRWAPKWYLWAGQAAVHTADYDAAVPWLQKAMLADPHHQDLRPWLALAYAGLRREEEGRALLAEDARERGALTIAAWRQRHPHGSGTLARQRERIEGLLRRLGVPEGTVQAGAVR